MYKRGVAVSLFATFAIAGAAFASGSSSRTPGHHGSGQPITVSGKTVQLNLVDAGEPGFTLGDQIAFSDDLVMANGNPAGVDGGVCTLTRVADAEAQSGTAQCLVTYSLKGGQITTQGLLKLTNGGFVGTQVAAITGGTGRYANARGASTLTFVRPGELDIALALRQS